jgi:acyl carrier protein
MNETCPSPSREEFMARLLCFINETLPRLDRRGRTWPPVNADSLLFDLGMLDSLSILHLLAKVEELTGRAVPDHLVVMRNFQTAEAIAETFCRV